MDNIYSPSTGRVRNLKPFTLQPNVCQTCSGSQNTGLLMIRHNVVFKLFYDILLFVPRHEISNNVVRATSKASDQPEHMRSLISAPMEAHMA